MFGEATHQELLGCNQGNDLKQKSKPHAPSTVLRKDILLETLIKHEQHCDSWINQVEHGHKDRYDPLVFHLQYHKKEYWDLYDEISSYDG